MLRLPLCLACLVFMVAYLAAGGKGHRVAAAVLKGCASASFVLVAVAGAGAAVSSGAAALVPATGPSRATLVLAGLCAGAIADVVINLRRVFASRKLQFFVVGAAAFLAGHVAYAASVWHQCERPAVAVVSGIAVTVLLMACVVRRVKVTAKVR